MRRTLNPSTVSVLIGIALCFPWSDPSQAGEECTLVLARGSATVDGRPLMMKSRDVSNADQEFVYEDLGPYAYIGVTYAGVTNQAWGGVNEVGFAICNANAWNFEDSVSGPDDDGFIQRLALRTCLTVEDFQAIMDSTDGTGRSRTAIYGVFDANGDGAYFEAANYEHFRYDLDDPGAAPNGYMVRANFAYSGGSYHLGQHRHDRALAFLDTAFIENNISYQLLCQTILRDLVNEEVNPYPLPFQGYDGLLPYGLIHTHDSINRDITRSAYVVQGIIPGEDPLLSTVWALAGEPVSTIALPLWVHALSAPPEFDGPEFSALNVKAQAFANYFYARQWSYDGLDTWKLINERGEGFLPFRDSLEVHSFAVGDSALTVWRNLGLPASSEVEDLQNSLAVWALAEMETWGPPEPPQVTITWQTADWVQLDWEPVAQDVFGRPITVSSYTIFGSQQPFFNRLPGDSITTVASPPVSFSAPETHRFFQVRCRP